MISFQIPRILEQYCGGQRELRVRGSTVREVFEEIRENYPALHQCLCTEAGAIRQHLHLFVNQDFLLYHEGAETRLKSGDVVSVYQAVSGG